MIAEGKDERLRDLQSKPQDSIQTNGTCGMSPTPGLWIAGLGAQYPPYLLGPEKLERFARRFHDVESPG